MSLTPTNTDTYTDVCKGPLTKYEIHRRALLPYLSQPLLEAFIIVLSIKLRFMISIVVSSNLLVASATRRFSKYGRY